MRQLAWRAAVVVSVVLFPAVTYGLGRAAETNRATVAGHAETIGYICSTTTVLDSLVLAAAAQIQLNFENGTYARLVADGTLTAENVEAARETFRHYRAAHRLLSRNQACHGSGP